MQSIQIIGFVNYEIIPLTSPESTFKNSDILTQKSQIINIIDMWYQYLDKYLAAKLQLVAVMFCS